PAARARTRHVRPHRLRPLPPGRRRCGRAANRFHDPAALMVLLLVAALLQGASDTVKTIDRGQSSRVATMRLATASTPAEWAALWAAHAPDSPLPAVDFSKNMVAAVFLGTRPTAGFGVEIIRARTDGQALVVEYAEKKPAAGSLSAQVLTSPYYIV